MVYERSEVVKIRRKKMERRQEGKTRHASRGPRGLAVQFFPDRLTRQSRQHNHEANTKLHTYDTHMTHIWPQQSQGRN